MLGEPASLGTLLELGNRTLDVLRNLIHRPPGQSITDPSGLPRPNMTPLGVKQGVIIARRNLEGILLYSVTQLAMWLTKPDFDRTPLDPGDPDDPHAMDTSRTTDSTTTTTSLSSSSLVKKKKKERRPRSIMAERLRRGITGEMAGDLQSLLMKSKAVMQSSDGVIGKPSIDITQILLNFLHDRISSSTS